MYCNYCGKNIQDDARVCAYCGRLIIGLPPVKRLERSRTDKKIAGVCAGMARYFASDPTLMRLVAILALLGLFPFALIAYIVAWIIIPLEPEFVVPVHAVTAQPQA